MNLSFQSKRFHYRECQRPEVLLDSQSQFTSFLLLDFISLQLNPKPVYYLVGEDCAEEDLYYWAAKAFVEAHLI
jgi:hypothetical protein